jgi:hypothetical protein
LIRRIHGQGGTFHGWLIGPLTICVVRRSRAMRLPGWRCCHRAAGCWLLRVDRLVVTWYRRTLTRKAETDG